MRRLVAVDVETYDPYLKTFGDGSCTTEEDGELGESRMLCVGTFDGQQAKAYFPFRDGWEEFKAMMADDSVDKVFHNGIYDLSWLCCGYDIDAKGYLHDTMTRMTYIDEYSDLDLDSCCKKLGVQGKNKADTIEAWWELHKAELVPHMKQLGIAAKKTDGLWKHSAFLFDSFSSFRDSMVKYNLQDCRATWYLYQAQESKMQKVYDAYMVDVKLTPFIIATKKKGVLINKGKLSKLTDDVLADLLTVADGLESTYGITAEMVNSPKQLGKRLNDMGIHSPVLTATGAESFSQMAFGRIHHPVIDMIQDYKALDALLNKYLRGGMANSIIHDGRIHCTFSPNKREDGGTVTGRFACLMTGTLVFTTEKGYIPIETIEVGMHTITHTGKVVSIINLFDNGMREVYAYKNIACTPDHLIWTGEDFKEAKDVCFNEVPAECRALQEDSRRLYERIKTDNGRASSKIQDDCSQYRSCYSKVAVERAEELRAWIESEQSSDDGLKCNERNVRRAASKLQRDNIRRRQKPDAEAQWALRNAIQENNGRCNRNRRGHASEELACASYRRGQDEQFTGQSCAVHERSSWKASQETSGQAKGLYLGNARVWDIEVDDDDHSFLANGYFVHNCSKPNLQNIPQRDKAKDKALKDKHYGQAIRSLFIPEEGCMMGAFDYSQIEYLLLAHFAVGQQAEWFREQANSGVDFHNVAVTATGIPSRDIVKTFNYGVIYGMGWKTAMYNNYSLFEKMAAEHNMTIEAFVQKVYNDYHARLPVIRETMKYVENIAKMQGYVTTIGGRLQHKPKAVWDPATGKMNDFIYKMLNKLIQGSAADILKFSMLECLEAGIFDVLTFHITVHDENVVSIPYDKAGAEAAMELKRIMDMSFHDKLRVPMKAAAEVGPDWGYWNDDIWNDMCSGKFDRAKECWWAA